MMVRRPNIWKPYVMYMMLHHGSIRAKDIGHHLTTCAGETHHYSYQNYATICDAAKEEEAKIQS